MSALGPEQTLHVKRTLARNLMLGRNPWRQNAQIQKSQLSNVAIEALALEQPALLRFIFHSYA